MSHLCDTCFVGTQPVSTDPAHRGKEIAPKQLLSANNELGVGSENKKRLADPGAQQSYPS